METFADRLREEIDFLGFTRNELALRADVKKRALDMYLGTQGSMPPADVAVRLARALHVTVEYLVTGEKKSEIKHSHDTRTQLNQELEICSKQTQEFFKTAVHLFSEYEKKR